MIQTSCPDDNIHKVASICQASLGRGQTKRRVAEWGRFCGCATTNPRRTNTRWMVATDGTDDHPLLASR
jgi:hypothetical protein